MQAMSGTTDKDSGKIELPVISMRIQIKETVRGDFFLYVIGQQSDWCPALQIYTESDGARRLSQSKN